MKYEWKKGKVRSFVDTFVQNTGNIQVKPNSRSASIVNVGLDTVFLYGPANVPLVSGASLVLGGYDDSYRSEFIPYVFEQVLADRRVIVIYDKQLEKPSFELER